MKKSVIVLTALLLLALNFSAFAQEEETERDVLEVNFYGGLGIPMGDMKDWHDSLGAKTGYEFGVEMGYFVTPKLITGIGFTYSQFGIDNSPTDLAADGLKHRLYNPNVYVKYNFEGESNWVPYVKGHVGADFAKFTTFVTNPNGDRYRQISYDPALSFGFGAGVFYYTADYGGLYLEANYNYISSSEVECEYEGNTYVFGSDMSTLEIRAGIRILIGNQ